MRAPPFLLLTLALATVSCTPAPSETDSGAEPDDDAAIARTDAPTDSVDAGADQDVATVPDDASTLDATTTAELDAFRADDAGPPPPIHVVVLGSSTAEGKNLDVPMYGGRVGGLADSWPNLYAAHLAMTIPGSTLTNLAKAGYLTFAALPTSTTTPIPPDIRTNPPMSGRPDPSRNVTHAISLAPDAILINFPALPATGYTLTQIVATHREIVDAAEAAGIPAWVALPNPPHDPALAATAASMRDALVAEFAPRVLDFYTPRVDDDGTDIDSTTLSDDAHPNAEGHRRLFDAVVAADIPGALGP